MTMKPIVAGVDQSPQAVAAAAFAWRTAQAAQTELYLVHGEPEGAAALAEAIRQKFRCQVDVAQDQAIVPVAA